MTSSDLIVSVEIDAAGSLQVKPATRSFEYIWRSAAEVHWDQERRTLYSPPPREWSYARWFGHIVSVVFNETGCRLLLSADTEWINVPTVERHEIIRQYKSL